MWLARIFNITDKKYLNSLSQAGTIGLHMVSGIVVGTLIGWGIDKWLETSPWFTGIFMVIGIVAGFKNVYVDTRRLIRTQKEEDDMRFSSQGQEKDADSRKKK